MNSAAAARCGCDPAEGVFFGCLWAEGGPPFVGTWGEGEPRGANSFARAPCREAFAEESVLVWANPFARAPCRETFAEESVLAWGQIPSLVRRVGRPSPRGVFLRGTNPFARAPCREAFAEGRVLAWGQILSLVRRVGRLSPRRAFSRGGKFCPPPRGIGKPWRAIGIPPRGARRPAGGAGSARGLGGRSGPRVGLPKALLQQP